MAGPLMEIVANHFEDPGRQTLMKDRQRYPHQSHADISSRNVPIRDNRTWIFPELPPE